MPIDKSMLAMMLMQSAPMLLQTLKGAVPSASLNKTEDFVSNRQYDAPLIGQTVSSIANTIQPNSSQLVSNNVLSTALDTTLDKLNNSPTAYNSDATDLDIYNLGNQMLSGTANNISDKNLDDTKSALSSAAAMLMNGLPTDEQIPNPATGMSALDWAYADLEQMPNSSAKHNLAQQLAQRSRASYGLKDFFNDNIRK